MDKGCRGHPTMGLAQLPGPLPKEEPRSQQDPRPGLMDPEVPSRSKARSQHLSASPSNCKERQDQAGGPAQPKHICTPNPEVKSLASLLLNQPMAKGKATFSTTASPTPRSHRGGALPVRQLCWAGLPPCPAVRGR